MTRWAIGGTMLLAGLAAVACLGLTRPGPEIVVNAPVTPEPAPAVQPRSSEPELTRVVDVTDIDPLLDPPTLPTPAGPVPVLTAVGYEEPAAPTPPAGDVPPIPPAAEGEPAAEVGVEGIEDDRLGVYCREREGLCDVTVSHVRTAWYGDAWGRIEGKVPDFWAEWKPFPADFARPAFTGGVGLFF